MLYFFGVMSNFYYFCQGICPKKGVFYNIDGKIGALCLSDRCKA